LYVSQGELNDLLIFNIELNLQNVNALRCMCVSGMGADKSNLKNACGLSLLTMVCSVVCAQNAKLFGTFFTK